MVRFRGLSSIHNKALETAEFSVSPFGFAILSGITMLDAMRQLALSRLWLDLDDGKSPDPEKWYRELRARHLGRLFPFLVEDVEDEGKGKEKLRYYTLSADPNDDMVAVLEAHEMKAADAAKLPFNQASGPQSAALGPLIKRTAPSKGKPAGPSVKVQTTTLKAFAEIGRQGKTWSDYFRAAHECWTRQKLRIGGREAHAPGGALQAAIGNIEEKRTVLLAFRDVRGKLPGEVSEYVDYLTDVLANTKYATGAVPAVANKTCALCGCQGVLVYPNGVKGAGINLANLDRDGAFPGLDVQACWKYYALCVGCADLLYVYWFHVARDFLTAVAGERALVVPTLNLRPTDHKHFLKRLKDWVAGAKSQRPGQDRVVVREGHLLTLLSEEQAVNTITMLWAEFGQRIDDVRGVVTDVLPSRLCELSELNRQLESASSAEFPELALDEFRYDISLTLLWPMLRRPGGKKVQKRNESRRLFDLRRDIAEAIYHRTLIPRERFWAEVHETARSHWDEAVASDYAVQSLLYEGRSEKKNTNFLTAAGWVRQLARFLHYLRMIGVSMPDPEPVYQPQSESLKPYFGAESAIRGPAKAFAFILGALYGKLLQVQAARGVNVGSNALTWLKRLTLDGNDLPELYVKIREKLMVYETEGSPTVRELVGELGELGTRLGTDIGLDETQTCYFLLLGQSLAVKMMPTKQTDKETANA